jgi:hypothetical protein
MGATHFLMKSLPRVAGEMALHVLAYNGVEGPRDASSAIAVGSSKKPTSRTAAS